MCGPDATLAVITKWIYSTWFLPQPPPNPFLVLRTFCSPRIQFLLPASLFFDAKEAVDGHVTVTLPYEFHHLCRPVLMTQQVTVSFPCLSKIVSLHLKKGTVSLSKSPFFPFSLFKGENFLPSDEAKSNRKDPDSFFIFCSCLWRNCLYCYNDIPLFLYFFSGRLSTHCIDKWVFTLTLQNPHGIFLLHF